LNQNLSGAEFAAQLTETLGQKLENPELVAILFETCQSEGISASFKHLALYAKSFQKIARLLSTDRANDDTKNKVRAELEGLLKKFSELVERILSRLPKEKREEFQMNFLLPTPGSFRNLRELLNDFVKVKDFLLVERDKGVSL
jgi:BMFP domain-containing protein YqiC